MWGDFSKINMKNSKYILFGLILPTIFLFSPVNKAIAETVTATPVTTAISAPSDIVSDIKYTPAKYDVGMKILERNEQELDQIKKAKIFDSDVDDDTANIFLKADDAIRLPDFSKLLKQYPHLQIHNVNSKGDYVGCISKSDYDTKQAFANIKGKLYVIGSVAGIYACASGINDNGEVVGNYEYKEGMSRGFLWKKGKITKLSMLKSTGRAFPERINNSGIIVGAASIGRNSSGTEESRAVQWVNGKIKDLGMPEGSDRKFCGWAFDINEYNQVLVDCGGRPALWQNGKMYFFDDLVSGLEDGERFDISAENQFNRNFFTDNSLIFQTVKCSSKQDKSEANKWILSCDYKNMKVDVPNVIHI